MALFRRQAVDSVIYDDQSPTLWGSFIGNWTRRQYEEFSNNTYTSTSNPGDTLSFTFSGSQVWLYGGVLYVGTGHSSPTAEYRLDGVPAGFQQPGPDSQDRVLYFQTVELLDRTHRIDIKVTTANETNPFIVDYFRITPSTGGSHSSVETSHSTPSSTSGVQSSLSAASPTPTSSGLPIVTTRSAPVGVIVGGVVGGIAGVVILVLAILWYFLGKRSRSGQAYYFKRPTTGDILAGEGHIEPFDITTLAPSSAGFSGPGPQPAHPDNSWGPSFREVAASPNPSYYSQFGPSEAVLTYVSGISAQPRAGQAALVALQDQDVLRPTQHQDSGTRFIENREQEAGPSRLPNEIPPTYS